MRSRALLALALLLFSSAARAEEPRAVLERAVTAMGLDSDPAKRPAILLHFRLKGSGDSLIEGMIHYGTNNARRLALAVHEGMSSRKGGTCVVLTETGGFIFAAHGIPDFKPEELASLRTTELLFSPLALLSLLDARDVTLKELDDVKVDGRPARRIRVMIGAEIAHLDFDKATGLLIRAAAKLGDAEHTSSFRDYGDSTQDADIRTLKAAGLPEAGFLTFLRHRARDPKALEKAIDLIPQLGDENYDNRERAAAALIDLGGPAMPVLRLALRDRDSEVVRQARHIIDILEKRVEQPALLRAAIRQTVYYRPRGAVAALLALVPDAKTDELMDIKAALAALAETDGQLEPNLVRALDDPNQNIRAVAEAIHGKDREALAKQPGRRIFPRDIRLPARIRTVSSGAALIDFEVVDVIDVQFFNSFDPRMFRKP